MSSLNDILIDGFNAARVQTYRYLSMVGVIGNLLNVIVFSHPTLNQMSTTRYFLAASGANLVLLLQACLVEYFQVGELILLHIILLYGNLKLIPIK